MSTVYMADGSTWRSGVGRERTARNRRGVPFADLTQLCPACFMDAAYFLDARAMERRYRPKGSVESCAKCVALARALIEHEFLSNGAVARLRGAIPP